VKPFGCKRTEPASPRRANSRSVATAGRIFRPVSGRRDSLGAGRRARVAVRRGRGASAPRVPRRTPVLLVGSPDGKNRRRGPVAGGAPSVGDEFRATFRPVLKHGPRSLTCARVNGNARMKNHVWRNESEPFYGADDGLATEPAGVQSRAGPQSGGVSAGSASAVRGRTLSAHVGTRKMVNYAWPG
jgi:hypothetical protein